jgi:hypothetical protein
LFDDAEYVRRVLHEDPGNVGQGVDVAGGGVAQAGAGYQGQEIERGVQAFADAGLKFGQWGLSVDQQDGLGRSGLGQRGVAG